MKGLSNKMSFILLACMGVFFSCDKKDTTVPRVEVSNTAVVFTVGGGTSEVTVKSNTNWTLKSYAMPSWVQANVRSGGAGSSTIQLTAAENKEYADRSAELMIATGEGEPIRFTVTQLSRSRLYPSYNTTPKPADATGMESTAAQIAARINLGWNIGNTLEAIGGETAWGNPKVTNALIKLVKQHGFNAIRIPCSWDQYADQATARIQDNWLNRVKEVVQLCLNNEVYVVLNIHWDGGWLENNVLPDKQEAVNAKQKAFWEQIATHLRDFDERLLFASANEPNVDNAAQMEVLRSYHQTFVNSVRATGGRNRHRVLVIQGPSTDIEKTNNLMDGLPADVVANKLMAEVHYYTPFNFCLMEKDESWGKMFYYWGAPYHSTTDTDRNANYGEEADVVKFFEMMKAKFTDKGIPVILGEFEVMRRTNLTGDNLQLHLLSRSYYFKYLVQQAKARGLLPFYWDTGSGVFDRTTLQVKDQQALDSLRMGAGL